MLSITVLAFLTTYNQFEPIELIFLKKIRLNRSFKQYKTINSTHNETLQIIWEHWLKWSNIPTFSIYYIFITRGHSCTPQPRLGVALTLVYCTTLFNSCGFSIQYLPTHEGLWHWPME